MCVCVCVTCLEFECFVIDITMYELCGHIGATKHIVLDTRSCLFYRRLHQQTEARRQKAEGSAVVVARRGGGAANRRHKLKPTVCSAKSLKTW